MSGQIPAQLGDLSNLEQLILGVNALSGEIPTELGGLSKLKLLWLYHNQLTGPIPTQLGNLSNLEKLSLNSNQLTGPIPTELGNLSNLTGLWLHGNELTGTIPAELGDLSSLTILDLNSNQLNGSIPVELGNLSKLVEVSFSGNELTGSIPTQLGNLTNLTGLWLEGNQLTGQIPRSFTNLASLKTFYFSDNAGVCAPTDEAFQAWLQGIEDIDGHSCDFAPDRAVLINLYNATGGANWRENTNWLSDLPMREWHGVGTDEEGRVVTIYLGDNQLSGEIPSELGDLSNLKNMRLRDNQLTGEIPPALGDLSNLKSLSLEDNQLSGTIPTQLGSLTNLSSLILRSNRLTGPVPGSFTGLTNLRKFEFYDNAGLCAPTDEVFQAWLQGVDIVRGEVCDFAPDRAALVGLYNATDGANWKNNSNWLTDLPMAHWHGVRTNNAGRVTWLNLAGNQLTGTIPTQVGNLANLTSLFLSRNQLTGPIPAELGNLSQLEWLSMDGNQLDGQIPAELGNLSQLEWLSMDGNQLDGQIPAELGSLSNLRSLSLIENQLSGTIPSQLGNLTSLSLLNLWNNQLTGELPASFTGLTNLKTLGFYNNTGLCAPVDATFQKWLQGIRVQGSSCAPVDSREDRAVLVKLYNATDGANWENNSNWLSDRPIRDWYGVTNDANGRVTGLYLETNGLSGPIPPELGDLSNLRKVDLEENQLSGSIPSKLGSLSNLEWLSLRNNQLTGSIPPELGNLSYMQWLELDNNQLTGSIPPELGNLSNVVGLFLSDNQFTGCIPAALKRVAFSDFDQLGLPTCFVPTVTMNADSATFQVRIDSPIPVTATFSRPVNDFTISDIDVTNGSAANFAGSDGDSVYTFSVIPNAIGVVTVDIPAGVAGDSVGYGNIEASQLTLGLPYDDDRDGAIGHSEILEAVSDYFSGTLSAQHVLELIGLYFQSAN